MVHKVRGFSVSICGYGIEYIDVETGEKLGGFMDDKCFAADSIA